MMVQVRRCPPAPQNNQPNITHLVAPPAASRLATALRPKLAAMVARLLCRCGCGVGVGGSISTTRFDRDDACLPQCCCRRAAAPLDQRPPCVRPPNAPGRVRLLDRQLRGVFICLGCRWSVDDHHGRPPPALASEVRVGGAGIDLVDPKMRSVEGRQAPRPPSRLLLGPGQSIESCVPSTSTRPRSSNSGAARNLGGRISLHSRGEGGGNGHAGSGGSVVGG